MLNRELPYSCFFQVFLEETYEHDKRFAEMIQTLFREIGTRSLNDRSVGNDELIFKLVISPIKVFPVIPLHVAFKQQVDGVKDANTTKLKTRCIHLHFNSYLPYMIRGFIRVEFGERQCGDILPVLPVFLHHPTNFCRERNQHIRPTKVGHSLKFQNVRIASFRVSVILIFQQELKKLFVIGGWVGRPIAVELPNVELI